MAEYVTIPLDIEGVKVTRVEVTGDGEVHIHVSGTVKGTRCRRCGRDIQDGYDEGREIKLRHLPILDMPAYLFLKPRRYVRRDCPGNPATTAAPALVRAPPRRDQGVCGTCAEAPGERHGP